MPDVRFEKWELDDLRDALHHADYQDSIEHVGYNSEPRFTEFLNRVVEVADRNRLDTATKACRIE